MKKQQKQNKKKKSHIPVRMNILFTFVFALFSLLILRLGVLQIVQGEEYTNIVQSTDVESVNYSVPRGSFYDRNYTKAVYNIPQKAITYTAPKNPQPDELLEIAKELSQLIDMTEKDKEKVTKRDKKDIWLLENKNGKEKVTDKEVEKLEDNELYKLKLDRITDEDLNEVDENVAAIYRKVSTAKALTPTIVKNDNVTDMEYAIVSENLGNLPGVDVTTDWERAYAYDKTFKGIIGKMSLGLPEEKAEYYNAKGYSLNDRVGASYLEEALEDVLQGTKSKVKTVTNKSGEVIDTKVVSEGQSGKDVVLTVDMDFQAEVEKILEEEILNGVKYPNTEYFNKAFVVVMNPKTGEVLSLAGKQYDKKNRKFMDYSHGTFTAAYEPGSTIKGATVLMGYQSGAIKAGTVLRDEAMYLPGGQTISSVSTMGNINEVTALEQSSNVYMAKIVLAMGGERYVRNGSVGTS